ncbi:sulfotransferase family protein [Qipengyuania flava]|uniref:sulfotransferase family protein n=1 Tax=Qipengyuania flava TaxID=192812 RepID=UPI001C62756A|nr:sulfotransferase [Qipengyuania flava]QYJ06660.1 sulfotransferase [Qipengyuania flava]
MPSLRRTWNRFKSYVGRPRMVVQQHAVVLGEHEQCQHPLFVLGPMRSGTSLVRRMLNSHPEIACPPESFFISQYASMAQDPDVLAGYEGLGFDRPAAVADLARKAGELHEAFRIAQGKPVWADKTPPYTEGVDAIDALFAQRPRYLLVWRHPWDAAHSLAERGWQLDGEDDLLGAALLYVRRNFEAMRAFAESAADRCASVRYSALCDNPEGEFAPALAKLGLAWHADMLAFGEKPHNFGAEDPIVRGHKTIKRSSGAWKGWSEADKARAQQIIDPADWPDTD